MKSVKLPPDVQKQVEAGISILNQGGIIAYPTDTVYGLGARPDNREAVERVYRVKNRPPDLALPLLLGSLDQINDVAQSVSETAWLLALRFLPGALTLILYRSAAVPDIVTAGGQKVAVRVPCHPVPLALIGGLGAPIVGTSANISGSPSALTAGEVRAQLGDRIDMVIDGGRCYGGRESTVVDATGEMPLILREGAISVAELRLVCENIKTAGKGD